MFYYHYVVLSETSRWGDNNVFGGGYDAAYSAGMFYNEPTGTESNYIFPSIYGYPVWGSSYWVN